MSRKKVETYVVTLRREVLQEAEVIVEEKSPAAATSVAKGMRDVVIWKTLDETWSSASYPPKVRTLNEPLPKKRKPKRKVRR